MLTTIMQPLLYRRVEMKLLLVVSIKFHGIEWLPRNFFRSLDVCSFIPFPSFYHFNLLLDSSTLSKLRSLIQASEYGMDLDETMTSCLCKYRSFRIGCNFLSSFIGFLVLESTLCPPSRHQILHFSKNSFRGCWRWRLICLQADPSRAKPFDSELSDETLLKSLSDNGSNKENCR